MKSWFLWNNLVMKAQHQHGPGDNCCNDKHLGYDQGEKDILKHKWALEQHVQAVGHVRHSPGMTFRLPKSSFHVLAVAFPSGQWELVERYINRDSFYISLFFPVTFLTCVKILSNCISACVPKPNFLDQRVAERVVGKRETKLNCYHAGKMSKTVHDVINSIYHWNVEVISCVDLWSGEEGSITILWVVTHFFVQFSKIFIWSPGVGIQYSHHYLLFLNQHSTNILHQPLHAPGNVRSFTFGLSLLHFMGSISHVFKFFFIFFNHSLCFLIGIGFMGLHG